MPARYADCSIDYIGKEDLIVNKKAVGRPMDLIDVQELESY